jgi:hypothetical protein
MRSAIICLTSKLDPCPWIVEDFRKKTGGDILRIIGSDVKQKDLSKYDRLYVMYQTELSPMNEVFIEFCNEYKKDLKNSTLVVSHPIRDIKSISERESVIEGIARFSEFWSEYSQKNSKKTLVLSTKDGNKRLVERFSTLMECEWKYIRDLSYNPYAYSVILCPYLFIMEGEEINSTTARLYIAVGTILFFAGILLIVGVLYIGSRHATRLGSISMVGVFLMYIGKRNLKNNRWRNKETATEKSRELAIFMLAIPGMGHIYLGRIRRGLVCILVTVTLVLQIAIAFLHASAEEAIISIYALVFVFFEVLWIYVDTEDICNKMGLHKGTSVLGGYSSLNRDRIENTKRIVIIVGGVVFLLLSTVFAVYIPEGRMISIVVFAVSLLVTGYASAEYYKNIDRKYCFDVPSDGLTYILPKIAVVYKGIFPSRATKRIAARYSADLIKMFKERSNEPLDLSMYDNVLIEYSPNLSKRPVRNYQKFLEVNSQWVKDAGFLVNIAYIYNHKSEPFKELILTTKEVISSYEEELGKKCNLFTIPVSDSPLDYEALMSVSSELELRSLLRSSEKVIDFKDSMLISFSNCGDNSEHMSLLFSYLMIPTIMFVMIFMVAEEEILFELALSVMFTLIPFMIIWAIELLTRVPKRFLYRRMIKEDGTFGRIKHRRMWGAACVLTTAIMAVFCGLMIFN